MKETKDTRKLLQDAIKSLPGDFALREVRFHVNAAIQKLDQVEERHAKAMQPKKTQAQSWDEMLKNGVQNPHTPGRTLDIINQMLGEEHRRLEEIMKKKQQPKQDSKETEETLFD